MGSSKVLVKKSAAGELERIPKKDLSRIARRIASLADHPRPDGSEKLSVLERYRVRQGEYRIVYAIDDSKRTVTIFKIGHRKEVFRS